MKFKQNIIILLILVNSLVLSGQFNLQTGYGVGFFNSKYSIDKNVAQEKLKNHKILHRYGLTFEYRSNKNLLFALSPGIDIHQTRHNLISVTNSPPGASSPYQLLDRLLHNSTIQNYKLGLAVGYLFKINDVSFISFGVQYDHFFVNRVIIKQSIAISEFYPININSSVSPTSTVESYRDVIDFDKIGFRNRFKLDNRYVLFSVGYRLTKNRLFFHPSFVYTSASPLLVRPLYQMPFRYNLLLLNFNIGYTFPQKNKTHEK
jgi:hypothetical protein